MKKLIGLILAMLMLITSCDSWKEEEPELDSDKETTQEEVDDPRDIPRLVLTKDDIVIEYGSKEVNPLKWVVSGLWKETELPEVDSMTVGKQDIIYKLIGNLEELEVPLTLTVVDSQNPVFEDDITTSEVKEGEELDLAQFKATDPVDGELKVTLKDGTLDTSIVEEQKAVVVAKDKNDNKTEKEVLVTVIGNEVVKDDEPKDESEKETEVAVVSPTQPTNPSPSQPNQPSQPNNQTPSQPTQPSQPVTSTPSQPTQPVAPTDPTPPVEQPVEPPQPPVQTEVCPGAWEDPMQPCDWIHPNLRAIDELGRAVPMFSTSQEAWDWGETQMYNRSWHGCNGFTRMTGHYNDGTNFYFVYMSGCP